MKLNLFSILLLNGFVLVVSYLQPDAPIFYLINKTMSWPNARSYCKAKYTDLAPIKTSVDLQTLKNESAVQNLTNIWLGLYNDVNGWRWSYNDFKLAAMTLRKWEPAEPNNCKGIERCCQISGLGGWGDYPCTDTKPFICYNANYPGDGRFIGINTPKSWTDAQTYCRTFHTDLATALDETDNTAIQQVASTQGDSWFGLYREAWFWIDYTRALNIPWGPGHPDNNNKDENCGQFVSGMFDDASCTVWKYVMCYYIPPIKRKMLKLQVTSDQFLMDPNVQASLLMQIVQKLEEHGMLKDVTVTWRLQTDGNIFHKK